MAAMEKLVALERRLTVDERMFPLAHYQEGAHTDNAAIGASFVPYGPARDLVTLLIYVPGLVRWYLPASPRIVIRSVWSEMRSTHTLGAGKLDGASEHHLFQEWEIRSSSAQWLFCSGV
jgi:hypothetical protein